MNPIKSIKKIQEALKTRLLHVNQEDRGTKNVLHQTIAELVMLESDVESHQRDHKNQMLMQVERMLEGNLPLPDNMIYRVCYKVTEDRDAKCDQCDENYKFQFLSPQGIYMNHLCNCHKMKIEYSVNKRVVDAIRLSTGDLYLIAQDWDDYDLINIRKQNCFEDILDTDMFPSIEGINQGVFEKYYKNCSYNNRLIFPEFFFKLETNAVQFCEWCVDNEKEVVIK